ncbi:MAG: hypothetical protein V4582_12780 [Pseudomonadota bacterium]
MNMVTKRISSARAPLTDEELRSLTVDQFFQLKLTNEEKERLREINQQREQERIERAARLRVEEEPILAELREIGWDVRSVWDLVNSSAPYPEAIPILLKHLPLPYSDVVKDGIARSLGVPTPEVQRAWSMLLHEYRKAPAGNGIVAPGDTRKYRFGAKDGLACALAITVTDDRLPELIALAKDSAHGESRILLLSALKKRRKKNPLAKQAIDVLAGDPDLQKEIASWGKR